MSRRWSLLTLAAIALVSLATSTGPAADSVFVHPGILHGRAELDFIKAQVKAGAEPWKSGWEALRGARVSQLDWKPNPTTDVVRGPYNKPDVGASDFLRDGAAAYSHAIQWYLTGEAARAEKAIEILNAYSSTLKTISGHDARLLVGMAGINFLNAAELIRHTHTGWRDADQKRFEQLLRNLFYPIIQDFYPTANGNWDAAMIQTMMAMGVFLDDRAMFDRAANYYLDGPGNGALARYINEFGECQESGRDQSHTQMGLGYLGCACEIGWKQGVDLYGAHNNRLAAGFEYTAKYNLGHDVPYVPYRSVEGRYNNPAISSIGRGRFSVIYEKVYHHYHDRMGMDMPFTRQVIEKIRPEGLQTSHVSWGTLMFAGLPNERQAAKASRQLESLGRGVVAIHQGEGKVYVGWRLLRTDPDDIAFNVYRSSGDGQPAKLNEQPIAQSTNFIDTGADLSKAASYFVRPVLNNVEQPASASFILRANAPVQPYISIPLQTPEGCTPNDASVGDLDGDGEYEVVLHQSPRGRDNAQRGTTGQPILEAYKLDGTFLWRVNLGRNIREGAHYTQFMVYDLDGDGRAEVACKTADGTTDGQDTVIGNPDADWRNESGYVLDGPEFLTIFDGRTGAELASANYIPPRGNVADWGDDYGNRVDRFLACIAYVDGERPSLVMCRGYYTRAVLAAWNWRDGKLTNVWTFDSDDGTSGNAAYRNQGNHNLSVGDVDGDGKDEIVYGACCIDHDGKGLYATGLGHGDAMHLSDIDPDRPGLEVFSIHERPPHPHAASMYDAATGKILWGKPSTDVGRGVAMDIDPRHKGYESWASGAGLTGYWNAKGEQVSDRKPRSCNFGVWWDADPLRELLDRNRISKWDWENGSETLLLEAEGCTSNNGSKSNPALCADILGDWREEVIWRTTDNKELRIYTTTIPTDRRLRTLMHDPQYRLSVAWQNVAYNQPTQPGFYLGENFGVR